MKRVVGFLGLFFFSWQLFAADLRYLVSRELMAHGPVDTNINYRYPTDTPLLPRITKSLQRLAGFNNLIGQKLFAPRDLSVNVTSGNSYLSAVCFPFLNSIRSDVSAWEKSDFVADGLLGHELGHLIFTLNALKFLEDEVRFKDAAQSELDSLLVTDGELMRKTAAVYEKRYPQLKFGGENVPVNIFANYQMALELGQILDEQKAQGREQGLKGYSLIKHQVLHAMGGLQEVFADFTGAVHMRDGSYLTRILPGELDRKVRNFQYTELDLLTHILDDTFQKQLLDYARHGIPHLVHYDLRQQIYSEFYRYNRTTIGANQNYDLDVMQAVMESYLHSFVKVYVEADPPKLKTATAAMVYAWAEKELKSRFEKQRQALAAKYGLAEYQKTAEKCGDVVAREKVKVKVKERVYEEAEDVEVEVQSNDNYRTMGM